MGRRIWDDGALEYAGLSRVRLDALLQELLGRVDEIMDSQERLRALLDAVVGIGADLDLNSTLDRIVTAACELADARYGALGVVGPDGKRLVRFITHGVSDEEIAAIGPYPEGHGILGLLIEHPEPIRMHDLAEHPRSYGFPSNHPPMKSFLGVPIRTRNREHAFGNLYLTEKTGGADFTEDDERTVTALAAAAGVVIDNARLYADTEQRRRSHEVTAEITQLMLGEFDAEQALQLIAQRSRELSGAHVAAVLLAEDADLVVRAVDGPVEFHRFLGRRVAADLPVLGLASSRDEQVVIEDLAQLLKDAGLTEFPEAANLGRTTVAPLPAGGSGTGGLLVVAVEQGSPTRISGDANLVRMFAGQVTLALERDQAQHDRDMLAVLEDRDRIARDLHDLVIQRLFATGLQLQGMHRLARPEHQQRLSRAVDDIDTTIHDLRAAIFQLQETPDSRSLRGDLQALVTEYTEPLGFRPQLMCTGPIDTVVPGAVRPQILATVRESLSNIVRHAQASMATVQVSVGSGEVMARISDDGVGIGTGDRRSGLRNLTERAQALGGSVQITSNEPHGTVVEFRAPTGD